MSAPACTFPHHEPIPATTTNSAGQPMCAYHQPVVVTGSWVVGAEKEE